MEAGVEEEGEADGADGGEAVGVPAVGRAGGDVPDDGAEEAAEEGGEDAGDEAEGGVASEAHEGELADEAGGIGLVGWLSGREGWMGVSMGG